MSTPEQSELPKDLGMERVGGYDCPLEPCPENTRPFQEIALEGDYGPDSIIPYADYLAAHDADATSGLIRRRPKSI